MVPTDRMRPSRTAIALAVGRPGSMVMIRRAMKTVISLIGQLLVSRPAVKGAETRSGGGCVRRRWPIRQEFRQSRYRTCSHARSRARRELLADMPDGDR